MSVSKKVLSVGLAAVLAASMIPAVGVFAADEEIPTLDQIKVGEDYQDLKASIKVLTNRTDIVDTVYKGYADEFMKMWCMCMYTYTHHIYTYTYTCIQWNITQP